MPEGIAPPMFPEEDGMATSPAGRPEEFIALTDPEPLAAMKNGCPGRNAIPQGWLKLCASFAAAPGTLDARLVWR
jgi:hypothetical protein